MSYQLHSPNRTPSFLLKSAGGVIAIGVLAAVLVMVSEARKRAYTKSMSEVVMVSSSTSSPATLTLAKFNGIKTGMSYKQVVAIIGAPGIMVAHDQIAGIVTESYMWQNLGNSNMTVTFRGDQAVSKAQLKLQ